MKKWFIVWLLSILVSTLPLLFIMHSDSGALQDGSPGFYVNSTRKLNVTIEVVSFDPNTSAMTLFWLVVNDTCGIADCPNVNIIFDQCVFRSLGVWWVS